MRFDGRIINHVRAHFSDRLTFLSHYSLLLFSPLSLARLCARPPARQPASSPHSARLSPRPALPLRARLSVRPSARKSSAGRLHRAAPLDLRRSRRLRFTLARAHTSQPGSSRISGPAKLCACSRTAETGALAGVSCARSRKQDAPARCTELAASSSSSLAPYRRQSHSCVVKLGAQLAHTLLPPPPAAAAAAAATAAAARPPQPPLLSISRWQN